MFSKVFNRRLKRALPRPCGCTPRNGCAEPRWFARAGLALTLGLALAACRSRSEPGPALSASTAPQQQEESAPSNAGSNPTSLTPGYEFISQLPGCEIEHHGLTLDFGTPAPLTARGYRARSLAETDVAEREGATFERMTTGSIEQDFWIDAEIERPMVSMRLFPGSARYAVATIDNRKVPSIRMPASGAQVVAFPALGAPLEAGRHRLGLRFFGAPRGTRDALAEIDWVRISGVDENPGSYSAPTLRDVVKDVVLDAKPRRSLVLRGSSSVRCWLRPGPEARLRVALGYWGIGKGTAEIRVISEGEAPTVLQNRKVAGGDGSTWTSVDVDLEGFAGRLIGVEFRAVEATRGGRVAFGDPLIVRKNEEPHPSAAASTAILVVSDHVSRKHLPPWGPTSGLSGLAELSRLGVALSGYRAASTNVSSVMASLLTGLAPHCHGVENSRQKLPNSVRRINEIVKGTGGRTAMFTGVPTSFADFGFNVGWDSYEAYSPVQDLAASWPYLRAARWLDEELDARPQLRRLIVLHVRGAHPPWDLTREEVAQLKPDEYTGAIDARRAGIVLGALRTRRARGGKRLVDEDWVRLRALQEAALIKQDAGLKELIGVLRRKSAWDSALILFLGDVGPGESPDLPFDPNGPLTEDRLMVPLLAKFPKNLQAGREIAQPVSGADIATTLLSALGVGVPEFVDGVDLLAKSSGFSALLGEPQLATMGNQYAARMMPWLLLGTFGKMPTLCQVDVDPACVHDVFEQKPHAARALWQKTLSSELRAKSHTMCVSTPEPATISTETNAALTVYGDVQ